VNYLSWFKNHSKKHSLIIDKLLKNGYDQTEIIDYFEYDNMILHESDFCLLYNNKVKCHEIDKLNCFLCGCPNFRFNDTKEIKSYCSISCEDGKSVQYGKFTHQDCSKCLIPHKKEFILKNFDHDWKKIMKMCESN
jgi:hypothetical protein